MMRALVIMFIFSSMVAYADTDIACQASQNTSGSRECAYKNLGKSEEELRIIEKVIVEKLIHFTDEVHSKEFLVLQEQWKSFVRAQCEHKRVLYGRGSFAGVAQITCEDSYTQKRITSLKETYSDVLASQ